jgi:hypothetical protein
MPEVAVDENGDPEPSKYDVGPARKILRVLRKAKSEQP